MTGVINRMATASDTSEATSFTSRVASKYHSSATPGTSKEQQEVSAHERSMRLAAVSKISHHRPSSSSMQPHQRRHVNRPSV